MPYYKGDGKFTLAMKSAQENHTNIQEKPETNQSQKPSFFDLCNSGWPGSSGKFHGTSGARKFRASARKFRAAELLGKRAEVLGF